MSLDLATLKAKGLPRAKGSDVMTLSAKPASTEADPAAVERELAAWVAGLDAYAAAFVPPVDGRTMCIGCGSSLSGLLGSFEWGLAHGEGHCCRCGYPSRAMHYVKIDGIGEIRFRLILQYHPDELLAGSGPDPGETTPGGER